MILGTNEGKLCMYNVSIIKTILIPLMSTVTFFLSGKQLFGLTSNTAVQVKLVLSDSITFDIVNVLLILMMVPVESVQFTETPAISTHCIVALYPSIRVVAMLWENGTVYTHVM